MRNNLRAMVSKTVSTARFVADTGHRTSAERIGWSFVFAGASNSFACRSQNLPWSPAQLAMYSRS